MTRPDALPDQSAEDNARQTAIRALLNASGWGDASIAPLAGDASNRRYLRLDRDGTPAVLMDAPPDRGEDVRPFIAMTEWLCDAGFSAPQIIAADIENGLLLLEDLGDSLYARHLESAPTDETTLYGRAVDLLVDLAQLGAPKSIGTGAAHQPLAPYDAAVLLREANLLTEWWMPAATGKPTSTADATAYADQITQICKPVAEATEVIVLRDYHAENLLWLPDRPAQRAVGLLDYQDALAGHPAYDLVSLLEDARRDTSDALQDAMVARYLAARPDLNADEFRRDYAILGAQRNLKIVGIFARLALRDGKPHYLDLIPRVWGHLQRDLSHPATAPLRDWVARHVPAPTPEACARAAAQVAQRGMS